MALHQRGQQADQQGAGEGRQRLHGAPILQAEAQLVAQQRQQADDEDGAVGAVVEHGEAAATRQAGEAAQRDRQGKVGRRGLGSRQGHAGHDEDRREAKGSGQQQGRGVGKTHHAGRRLVLQQIEEGGDQRKARDQEQHGCDDADAVPGIQARPSEQPGSDVVEAGGEQGTERRDGELVEVSAEQDRTHQLADATGGEGGEHACQIGVVQVGEGSGGESDGNRDHDDRMLGRRRLDGIEPGAKCRRREVRGRLVDEALQATHPRGVDAERPDTPGQRHLLVAAACRGGHAGHGHQQVEMVDAETGRQALDRVVDAER